MNVASKEGLAPPNLILLLEDDPANRELMKFQLESLGYDSDALATGEEGYEQWQAKRHRIVFTDCNLPGMSGFDLAIAIRQTERDADTPTMIIGITGYRLEDVADDYRNSGMDNCLAKPILLSDLSEIIPNSAPANAADVTGDFSLSNDQARLDTLVLDNRDNCKKLLSMLVSSLQEGMSGLVESFSKRSTSDFNNIAHRLRSSALAVGAEDLAGRCRAAEVAAKEENWQILDELRPSLFDAINDVAEHAMDVFPGGWKNACGDRICPLAVSTFQPFRAYCGQCEFRVSASPQE